MNMFDKALLSLPGIRSALATVCLAALLRALLAVGQAGFLSTAVVALCDGAAIGTQALPIAAFLVCFLGQQLVACLQDAFLSRYAAARADELRDELLARVFDEGPQLVAARGTGSMTSAVIEDIDNVESYIQLMLPKAASLVIVPLVLVVVAFALDWVSGLIMLVAFPTIVLFMVLIGYNAQDASAKRYREFTVLANHFLDSLRGLDTLKLFGRSKAHGSAIFAVSERFREATMKTLRIAMLSSAVLDLAATLALAAVAIMLGFRMVEGGIAFFDALFVLVLTPEFFKPVREFAADYHASLDGRTAFASIRELLEGCEAAGNDGDELEGGAPASCAAQTGDQSAGHDARDGGTGADDMGAPASSGAIEAGFADDSATRASGAAGATDDRGGMCEDARGGRAVPDDGSGPLSRGAVETGPAAGGELGNTDGSAPIANGGAGADDSAVGSAPAASNAPTCSGPTPVGAIGPWGASSMLVLRDVGVSYDGQHALQGVDLRIEGLQRVGIVGASGSGKSTLVNVLAGFTQPTQGTLELQGTSLRSLHRTDWQRQVLYIPQDPHLFSATLRDNIAFYTPDAADAAIMRAVELVGLEELLRELPQGLDTVVGEGARALSGGERQRVALARALLDTSRSVLLFDEPTAHLDIETELELKERMLPVMQGRLTIFATHRLHWVADMDIVAVLEGGSVAQVGTPGQLRAAPGAYSRLAAHVGGDAL